VERGNGQNGLRTQFENAESTVAGAFVGVQMFNFLVLGVDSVSRLNFARHMPRTRRFLLEELSAVELSGFNKVNNQPLLSLFVSFVDF